jgi:co-chaperonin GroES (HSP10)
VLSKSNFVIIEPDEDNYSVNGLMIDTDERKYYHASVSGTVVAVPEKLIYYGREAQDIRHKGRIRSRTDQIKLGHYNQYGTSFDVPVEVKVGDKVMFKHMSIAGSDFMGTKIPVLYDMLILRYSDNEVYPLNGYILVEPIEREIIGETVEMKGYGTIAHLGCKVGHYKDYPRFKDGDVNVGDFIMFHRSYSIQVETELHRKLDKRYFYLHRRNVLAIGDSNLLS